MSASLPPAAKMPVALGAWLQDFFTHKGNHIKTVPKLWFGEH